MRDGSDTIETERHAPDYVRPPIHSPKVIVENHNRWLGKTQENCRENAEHPRSSVQ
jgi:hypothetical protein